MSDNKEKVEVEPSELVENQESDEFQEMDTIEELIKEDAPKLLTKNEEAKELIKSSSEIIEQADADVESTKNIVSENVNQFEKSKSELLNSTFTHGQVLLERAAYEYSKKEEDEPFEISLGTVSESVKVSNVSSGAFTGFLLSIIALIGTVVTWLYIASTKVGVTLNPEQLPPQEDLTSIFTWIGGGMTGGAGNPMFGEIITGVTALLVAWIVYKVRVSTKENKNIKVANRTLEESHIYAKSQQELKSDMEIINEHIISATATINDYRILLNEQNAKLERVLHVEGLKEENSEYHSSSKDIMQDSEELMRKVEDLFTIPITKDGKLNENSKFALIEAKALYNSYISKLYA